MFLYVVVSCWCFVVVVVVVVVVVYLFLFVCYCFGRLIQLIVQGRYLFNVMGQETCKYAHTNRGILSLTLGLPRDCVSLSVR